MIACAAGEWATALVAVLAALVLVVRELKREPSGGIPTAVHDGAGDVGDSDPVARRATKGGTDG